MARRTGRPVRSRQRAQAQKASRLPFYQRFRWFYTSPIVPVIGIIILIFAIIGGVLFLRQGTSPKVGDHWHAIYQINVCGEAISPFPATDGTPGIHTHGDGLIHIHPNSTDDEGKTANLDRFFTPMGVTLRSDMLKLPDGREFHNGDACPDGNTGNMVMQVGKAANLGNPDTCADYVANNKFEKYVAHQDECVLIEFKPENSSGATPTPSPSAAPTLSPAPISPPTPAVTPTPSS